MKNEDVVSEDLYREFKFTSRNPYGFWRISWIQGGSLPQGLEGQFTTWEDCKVATEAYYYKKEQEDKRNSKSHAEKHKEKVLAKKATEEAKTEAAA